MSQAEKSPALAATSSEAPHNAFPNSCHYNPSYQAPSMSGGADIYKLLDRLERVKKTRSDSWTACCPAHEDRHPSMNVRLADDGKILLKCWIGCSAADIVAAVGLEMQDLFPRRERDTWSRPVTPSQRWIPRDVIASLAQEALIVVIAADSTANGEVLSDEDRQRLALSAGRIRAAVREVQQ